MSVEAKCIDKLMNDARAEGYRQAIEDAAKVVEGYSSNDKLLHAAFEVVAQRIRALLEGK